jgi:FkbM family methyltransferase
VAETLQRTIAEAAHWAARNRDAQDIRRRLQAGGCYIYGAGGYGREVAATLQAQAIEARGFIDGSIGGGRLVAGLPSWLREEVDVTEAATCALIIAVNNFKSPVDEIVRWAEAVGFADIVPVAELPDVLDPGLGHYWQASRALIGKNVAQLDRLHALLGDERSREILIALARYRITGRAEHHPPVDRDHQYFPVDLPLGCSSISLVDCGAFPGDMIEAVARAGLDLENWYAFEPDPANFRHLRAVAGQARVGAAALFPCGVGSETGLIRFADGAADASRALGQDDQGGVVVPIVRVADVVHARHIDMVKLDVEGFESAAIDGMVELLERHRPRLAVAIYHKPADLWELAFKIDALFPGARYAIRQHGYNGYDTVLYVDL